jgi:hypothetical protein
MTTKQCRGTYRKMRVRSKPDQVRIFRKRVLAVLAAGTLLLADGVASAVAQVVPPGSGEQVELDYNVSNVQPGTGEPAVVYDSGVIGNAGGIVEIQSGAIRRVGFFANAWTLIPTGTATLDFTITDQRVVKGATVTGTAHVPPGSSMTVTNATTGQTITLQDGPFSISTGVGTLGAPKAGHDPE